MSPICVIIMFSSAGVTLDASYNVQLDLDPCFCLCRLTPKIGLGGKLKSYFVHFLAVKGGKVSRFPGGQVTVGGKVEREYGLCLLSGRRQTIQLLGLDDIIASFVQTTIHLRRFGFGVFLDIDEQFSRTIFPV